MNQISELDLQNLRHLIGGFDTTHCKMEEYASKATDAQVKQFFQKSAQSAVDCKNQLMQRNIEIIGAFQGINNLVKGVAFKNDCT